MAKDISMVIESVLTKRILPLRPVHNKKEGVEELTSLDTFVNLPGADELRLGKLVEFLGFPSTFRLNIGKEIFGAQLVSKLSKGQSPIRVSRIKRTLGEAPEDLYFHCDSMRADILELIHSHETHHSFDEALRTMGSQIGNVSVALAQHRGYHEILMRIGHILTNLKEIEKKAGEEHKEAIHSMLNVLQKKIDPLVQNSFGLRSHRSLDGQVKGDALIHFDSVEQGIVFYLSGEQHESPRERLPKLFGNDNPYEYSRLFVSEGTAYHLPAGVEYAMLGGFNAYRVMHPLQQVEFTDQEGKRNEASDAKDSKASVESWRKPYYSDPIYASLEALSVEAMSVPAIQSPSKWLVETSDAAVFAVASGGDIMVGTAGCTEGQTIPQGNAAILLPTTAFHLRSAGHSPVSAMLIRLVVG